jgi:hypothetical protein
VLVELLAVNTDHIVTVFVVHRAAVAQSVQRLSTGWTTEESDFESRLGQEF